MHEKRFHGNADFLRSPERRALMEVPRVLDLSLAGITAATALDVGTGTGLFAEEFAARGLSAVGIDANPEMVQRASTLAPALRFLEGTAEKLPFPDRSFDLVFLGQVLHEAEPPLAALTEAYRVARARVAVLEWPYREEEQGPPFAHRLEPKAIIALARRAGFRSVQRHTLTRMELFLLDIA